MHQKSTFYILQSLRQLNLEHKNKNKMKQSFGKGKHEIKSILLAAVMVASMTTCNKIESTPEQLDERIDIAKEVVEHQDEIKNLVDKIKAVQTSEESTKPEPVKCTVGVDSGNWNIHSYTRTRTYTEEICGQPIYEIIQCTKLGTK